jgi:hypothetical protein
VQSKRSEIRLLNVELMKTPKVRSRTTMIESAHFAESAPTAQSTLYHRGSWGEIG